MKFVSDAPVGQGDVIASLTSPRVNLMTLSPTRGAKKC